MYTEEEEVPSVIVSGFYAQKAYGGGADAVYAYTVMMMIRVRNCVRCYWREKKIMKGVKGKKKKKREKRARERERERARKVFPGSQMFRNCAPLFFSACRHENIRSNAIHRVLLLLNPLVHEHAWTSRMNAQDNRSRCQTHE